MNVIYAIPGLGTTKELYRNIHIPNYELKVLDWPPPEKNMRLETYAQKFIAQIDRSKPVNLIGVSFGGMLCTELAESLSVNKVFLISSSANSVEFPRTLRALKGLPLYRLLSDKLIRRFAKTKRKFIGFEKSFGPVYTDMIDRMPENYFSFCVDCIINWNRKTNGIPLIRIHGTSDRLLSRLPSEQYYEIKGGSHAMVLSHAREINVILNKELNGI